MWTDDLIPRQNLPLPVGGGIFLRLVGTQLLKPKKVTFFLHAAITFPFCSSPPSCKRKTQLSEIQYIYLCIYIKCDAGRSLLPETLDASGPKLCWNQLEPFIHSSVGIFRHTAWSCTPEPRLRVWGDLWIHIRNGTRNGPPPTKLTGRLFCQLSVSPVQQE